MKIIFVGMHNKPNKMPLCPSTKTGKIISRIIGELKPIECLRTNLYDIDFYPETQLKWQYARDWIFRINPQPEDIVVLLGQEVHNNYIKSNGIVIKLPHPASNYSKLSIDEYVKRAVREIKVKVIANPN
jgi:hypothetical protein